MDALLGVRVESDRHPVGDRDVLDGREVDVAQAVLDVVGVGGDALQERVWADVVVDVGVRREDVVDGGVDVDRQVAGGRGPAVRGEGATG
ncbi:hypothetical protein AB0F17_18890 [Nonomuraea sp. NPDC026600]|uniref:hypothetical protein n=1 Tax=Nonomuraea sp. NPDC026600 TaxID=3155363 RepID=UPI0033D3ED98